MEKCPVTIYRGVFINYHATIIKKHNNSRKTKYWNFHMSTWNQDWLTGLMKVGQVQVFSSKRLVLTLYTRQAWEQTTINCHKMKNKCLHFGIWWCFFLNHHEECTEISTNMSGIGSLICEIDINISESKKTSAQK